MAWPGSPESNDVSSVPQTRGTDGRCYHPSRRLTTGKWAHQAVGTAVTRSREIQTPTTEPAARARRAVSGS